MRKNCRIKMPEVLQFQSKNGRISYGISQSWYQTASQKRAGCAPTAAANQILYMAKTGRLPMQVESNAQALRLLDVFWDYITPRLLGVHKVSTFRQGMRRWVSDRQFPLRVRSFTVGNRLQQPKVDEDELLDFIADALQQDCPLAFLNLWNGGHLPLCTWHWVTIVGLDFADDGLPRLEIYDGYDYFFQRLDRWLEERKLGGGFVYTTDSI